MKRTVITQLVMAVLFVNSLVQANDFFILGYGRSKRGHIQSEKGSQCWRDCVDDAGRV